MEAAVNATRKDTGANIIYVDVTEQFEGHGIGSSDDPFINAPGQTPAKKIFTPMRPATAHMPRPSQPRCETIRQTKAVGLSPGTAF
jgi:hypothetical protein